MHRISVAIATILFLLVLVSCSGSSISPAAPDLTDSTNDNVIPRNSQGSDSFLWGIWDIHIDTTEESAEIIPLRGPAFTANVTRFVDGPPPNLLLDIGTIDMQPDYMDIPVDVGLQHPFPGLDVYTGFDVIGVFMSDGSAAYLGPDGFPVAGPEDQQLLNPDGYTRWFNQFEFKQAGGQMPLLGYVPGKLGTPGYEPSALLNPYKYFADGLDKDTDAFDYLSANPDNRAVFYPGTVNHRQYDLRFPNVTGVTFQYAVVAHWEPNANDPEPPGSLDDFPISANADEALAIKVEDTSTTYFAGPGSFGGNVILDISVLDWSAVASDVMDEYAVTCWSPAWSAGTPVDMTPTASGDNYYTYHADIPVETVTSADDLKIWIEVTYPGLTYENPFGVENDADGDLASYFIHHSPVGNEIPAWIEVISPNGGETLIPGSCWDITWTSEDVTGTVEIEYSKDNFVSDVNVIASGEVNDGEYTWSNIADDPSETVRVRVSATDMPAVFDTSDADFTIEAGEGWVRAWGDAGNDRGYGIDRDDDGNLYVTGFYTGGGNFNPDPNDPPDFINGFGSWDSFVTKFDADGDYIWAAGWGATGYADGARDVAVDADGNVYVCGWWQNNLSPPQIDLDPGPGTDWFYGTVGDNGFLVKLDSNGDYLWGASWNSGDWEWFDWYAVDVDSNGDVYIGGTMRGTADMDPGSGVSNLTSNNYNDCVMCKLDSSGNFEWAYNWGGYWFNYVYGIEADSSDNILVAGYFSGTGTDLDPTSGVDLHDAASTYDYQAFVSSFTTSGGFNWANSWGGNSSDYAYGIGTDPDGSIYVVGSFSSTDAQFDPDGGDSKPNNGSSDCYVSKFDSGGNYQWAHTWGGSGADTALGFAPGACDSVSICGYFSGTVDFDPDDPGGPFSYSAYTSHDSFILNLDGNQDTVWARAWGGEAQSSGGGVEDEAWGIVSDESGNFFLTGSAQNNTDFDPGPGTYYHNAVTNDVFLLKLKPNGLW